MPITIYHNPRCSKSRQALALLEEAQADVTVIDYLKTGLEAAVLQALHAKTGGSVRDMMRAGEARYKELGLKQETDEAKLLAAMVAHPILLERPLVSDGTTALVCRPPELVSRFLG